MNVYNNSGKFSHNVSGQPRVAGPRSSVNIPGLASGGVCKNKKKLSFREINGIFEKISNDINCGKAKNLTNKYTKNQLELGLGWIDKRQEVTCLQIAIFKGGDTFHEVLGLYQSHENALKKVLGYCPPNTINSCLLEAIQAGPPILDIVVDVYKKHESQLTGILNTFGAGDSSCLLNSICKGKNVVSTICQLYETYSPSALVQALRVCGNNKKSCLLAAIEKDQETLEYIVGLYHQYCPEALSAILGIIEDNGCFYAAIRQGQETLRYVANLIDVYCPSKWEEILGYTSQENHSCLFRAMYFREDIFGIVAGLYKKYPVELEKVLFFVNNAGNSCFYNAWRHGKFICETILSMYINYPIECFKSALLGIKNKVHLNDSFAVKHIINYIINPQNGCGLEHLQEFKASLSLLDFSNKEYHVNRLQEYIDTFILPLDGTRELKTKSARNI